MEYGKHHTSTNGPDIEGGVLNNIHNIMGQTVEDVLEGDYWRANKDLKY